MEATWTSPDGTIRLFHGRCEDVLPGLHSGDVGVVLADPPWGVNNDNANDLRGRSNRPYAPTGKSHDFAPCEGDEGQFDPSLLLRFPRLVLWGGNHYANRLPQSSCWFCWDRKADKAADCTVTDCELAWVRGLNYRTTRMFRHMWVGFQRDSQTGEQHFHPMEKPVALMEWCLDWFPPMHLPSSVVLDPYMGSGPVALACIRQARPYIGVEVNEQYFTTAVRRIEAELARHPLLDAVETMTQGSLLT